MYVDVARLRRNCLFIGKSGNINIYSRTIFLSAQRMLFDYVTCVVQKSENFTFECIDTMKGVVTYVY